MSTQGGGVYTEIDPAVDLRPPRRAGAHLVTAAGWLEKAGRPGVRDGFRPVLRSELPDDPVDMRLDGPDGEEELVCDLPVRAACGDELEDLEKKLG